MSSEAKLCPFCATKHTVGSMELAACEAFIRHLGTRYELRAHPLFVAGFRAGWNRRAEPPCPPEVERLASAAEDALALLVYLGEEYPLVRRDRISIEKFGVAVAAARAALAPFGRAAVGDGKNP
jgi:hypothetical protein